VYDDEILTTIKPSVTLVNLTTRQELTSSSDIAIAYAAPEDDEVTTMVISFNDIEAYNGAPVTSFRYDKDDLPDTDYTLKIEIYTALGRHDYVTKRSCAGNENDQSQIHAIIFAHPRLRHQRMRQFIKFERNQFARFEPACPAGIRLRRTLPIRRFGRQQRLLRSQRHPFLRKRNPAGVANYQSSNDTVVI
jgi:hypothetical protein